MAKENGVYSLIEGITYAAVGIIALIYVVKPALKFFNIFTFSGDATTGTFVVLLMISSIFIIFYMIISQFIRS